MRNQLERCASSELETLVLQWPRLYTPVKHQLHLEQFKLLRDLVLKHMPPQAISMRSQMVVSRVVLFDVLNQPGLYQKFQGSNIQEIKA